MIVLSSQKLALILCFYVLSGVLQPIVLEVLNYHGSCNHSTMLFALPTYLGMSLTYFSQKDRTKTGITSNNYHIVCSLCLLDVLSQTLNLLGLVLAGSLVFTIM